MSKNVQKRPKMSKMFKYVLKVQIYQSISKHDEIKQKNHFVPNKKDNIVTIRTSRRSSWSNNTTRKNEEKQTKFIYFSLNKISGK